MEPLRARTDPGRDSAGARQRGDALTGSVQTDDARTRGAQTGNAQTGGVQTGHLQSGDGQYGGVKRGNVPRRAERSRYAGSGGGQCGLLLIEVLAGLVVCGVVLVLLSQGYRFALLALRMQDRVLAPLADCVVAEQVLRSLIEGADPGAITGRGPFFDGRPERLSFTGDLPGSAAMPVSTAADITLSVNARHQLELRWLPHLAAALAPEPRSAVLLDGVTRVRFGYRGGDDGTMAWQPAWQAATLPALVRISIVPLARDRPAWPDIVIAPRRAPPSL